MSERLTNAERGALLSAASGHLDEYGDRIGAAVEHIITDRMCEAWHKGWVAGCNDQQYGDENARPWTPNPYAEDARADREWGEGL